MMLQINEYRSRGRRREDIVQGTNSETKQIYIDEETEVEKQKNIHVKAKNVSGKGRKEGSDGGTEGQRDGGREEGKEKLSAAYNKKQFPLFAQMLICFLDTVKMGTD